MSLSFNRKEIEKVRHPADVALALRQINSRPSPTEVAAAANRIRLHVDPESPPITTQEARNFMEFGQKITTANGLSIGYDDSVSTYPRSILIRAESNASENVRHNLEGLRISIS